MGVSKRFGKPAGSNKGLKSFFEMSSSKVRKLEILLRVRKDALFFCSC